MAVVHNVQFIRQQSEVLCWLACLQMLIRYEIQRGRQRLVNPFAHVLLTWPTPAVMASTQHSAGITDTGFESFATRCQIRPITFDADYSNLDPQTRNVTYLGDNHRRQSRLVKSLLDQRPFAFPCLVQGGGSSTPFGHYVLVRGYEDRGGSLFLYFLDPAGNGEPNAGILEYNAFFQRYWSQSGRVYTY
jgi:hypothetical protein